MKKIVLLLTILTLTFTLFGCSVNEEGSEPSGNEDEDTTDIVLTEKTMEDIITATYEASGLELPGTGFLPLAKENQVYMLGTDSFDFNFGIVSEPMMSSVAHSFVMFTVNDEADIEAIKESIRSNVDPRKWICVGVEPEQVIVENFDNTIVLIMNENSAVIYDALATVMEGTTVISSELAESSTAPSVGGMLPETEGDAPVADIPTADPVEDIPVAEIPTNEEGSALQNIITATYEASGLELPMTGFIPLTKENQVYMTGSDTFEFIEGVVSEPMMSSVAHSIVLFTVEDGADIDGIKETIRTNIDLRKWVCVSIEPEQLVVENFDNMIVIIMEERSDIFFETMKNIME